jgi:hypothetical protein
MTILNGGPHDIINEQAQQAKLVVGVSILSVLYAGSTPCITLCSHLLHSRSPGS